MLWEASPVHYQPDMLARMLLTMKGLHIFCLVSRGYPGRRAQPASDALLLFLHPPERYSFVKGDVRGTSLSNPKVTRVSVTILSSTCRNWVRQWLNSPWRKRT